MLEYQVNKLRKGAGQGCDLSGFGPAAAEKVRSFHKGLPGYAPTDLVSLAGLARHLGLASLHVKDESTRFGLQSFKALGGSYAMARILQKELGLSAAPFDFTALKAQLGGRRLTFASATDGNHGRGVAWTAKQLGQDAVIYMPKGAAPERVGHICALGAQCIVTEYNYDDTVRLASEEARRNGWIIVQDTAWPGYEEIPALISQGYLTLAAEAADQLEQAGAPLPTHLFLQAGVGSFAAAVLGYFVNRFGDRAPLTVIVEPERAACFHASMKAGGDLPQAVGGDLETIMAGLACGEPSSLAWPVIRDYSCGALSCADEVAALGMRVLAAPLTGDRRVISGESGAAPLGALVCVLRNGKRNSIAELLNLNERSHCLVVNTEGNTSLLMYESIVWEGRFPWRKK